MPAGAPPAAGCGPGPAPGLAAAEPFGSAAAGAVADDPGRLLPVLEVETAPSPRFSVIWLHGLGADGAAFRPVVPMLRLGMVPAVRFVFPTAPAIPVTSRGGAILGAWYDILSAARNARRIDESSLLRSREAIRRLIRHENGRGIPEERIFVAGFSQGGAMAYATGLTHAGRLAGVIALSAYLPASELVGQEVAGGPRATPIFAAHGTEDPVVSLAFAEEARDTLLALGYPLEWRTFPMPHSVCIRELRAVGAWLRQRMAALERAA